MSSVLFTRLHQRKFVKLSCVGLKVKSRRIKRRVKKAPITSIGARLKLKITPKDRPEPMSETIKRNVVTSTVKNGGISDQRIRRHKYRTHDYRDRIESVLLTHHPELLSSSLSNHGTHPLVRKRALEIAASLGFPRKHFKGTKKWLNDFLQRYKLLGLKTVTVKLNAADIGAFAAKKNVTLGSNGISAAKAFKEPKHRDSTNLSTLGSSSNKIPDLAQLFATPPVTPQRLRTNSADEVNATSIQPTFVQTSTEEVPDLLNLFLPEDTVTVTNKSKPRILHNANQSEEYNLLNQRRKDVTLERNYLVWKPHVGFRKGPSALPYHCLKPNSTGYRLTRTKKTYKANFTTLHSKVYDDLFDVAQENFDSTANNTEEVLVESADEDCSEDDATMFDYGYSDSTNKLLHHLKLLETDTIVISDDENTPAFQNNTTSNVTTSPHELHNLTPHEPNPSINNGAHEIGYNIPDISDFPQDFALEDCESTDCSNEDLDLIDDFIESLF